MHWLSTRRNIFLMMIFTLVLYTTYIIIPVGIAFYYSLTRFSGLGRPRYIGLRNYARAFEDANFIIAFKNSMIIFVVAFVILMIASFLTANLLNRRIRHSDLFKSLIFSPAIIAPIVVGIVWVFILDPEIGFLNALLRAIGAKGATRQWIGGESLTPYSVAIVFCWQQLGFFTAIFTAGFKMIPAELFESSAIDGTSPLQELLYIKIPMLKETIKIVAVLVITGCFKVFEIVLQLTNGGPNHLSEVLVTYTYNRTFLGGEYGYGMSVATITFFVSMVFSVLYLVLLRKRQTD